MKTLTQIRAERVAGVTVTETNDKTVVERMAGAHDFGMRVSSNALDAMTQLRQAMRENAAARKAEGYRW